jgi:hypothetical protein
MANYLTYLEFKDHVLGGAADVGSEVRGRPGEGDMTRGKGSGHRSEESAT